LNLFVITAVAWVDDYPVLRTAMQQPFQAQREQASSFGVPVWVPHTPQEPVRA